MSLRNKNVFYILKNSPRYCTRIVQIYHQETSFRTRHKASLTIEATVVIPLAAGFLLSLLFFFRVIQVQTAVDEAIVYAGRVVAVESSVVSTDTGLLLSAEGLMLSALQENSVVEKYIEGGAFGIHLLESEINDTEICLQANYKMKLPISLFGLRSIQLYSQNVFRKWNGDITGNGDVTWVYITPNGSVYHASSNCRVLDLSIKETTSRKIAKLRGKNGQKYYACSSCCTEETTETIVYYTDYGYLYHKDVSCSALKRTVTKISIEDVAERRACSYCYSK